MVEEAEVEVVVVVAVEVPLVGVGAVEGVAPVATVSIFYFSFLVIYNYFHSIIHSVDAWRRFCRHWTNMMTMIIFTKIYVIKLSLFAILARSGDCIKLSLFAIVARSGDWTCSNP